ncbi:MAG: hypothetical protein WA705_20960 [Candidatus Ozemobacteraceae bacterium]
MRKTSVCLLLAAFFSCALTLCAAPQIDYLYQSIKRVESDITPARLKYLKGLQNKGQIILQQSEYNAKAWFVLTPPQKINSVDELKAAIAGGDASKYLPTESNEALVGAFQSGTSAPMNGQMAISLQTKEFVTLFNDRGLGEKYPAVSQDLSSVNVETPDIDKSDSIRISTADTQGRNDGAFTIGHEMGGHGTFKVLTDGHTNDRYAQTPEQNHEANQILDGRASNMEGWANYQGMLLVPAGDSNSAEGYTKSLNELGIVPRTSNDGTTGAIPFADSQVTFDQAMNVEAVNARIYYRLGELVGHNRLSAFAGTIDQAAAADPTNPRYKDGWTQMETLRAFVEKYPETIDKLTQIICDETRGKRNPADIKQALATPFLKVTVPVAAGSNDILDPSTDVTKAAIASLSNPEIGKSTSENNSAKPVQVVPSAGPFSE